MITEIVPNMHFITCKKTEEGDEAGLRVQTTVAAGRFGIPQTVSSDVFLRHKHLGISIRELQIEAVTRSIEILQQFLDVSEKSAADAQ